MDFWSDFNFYFETTIQLHVKPILIPFRNYENVNNSYFDAFTYKSITKVSFRHLFKASTFSHILYYINSF